MAPQKGLWSIFFLEKQLYNLSPKLQTVGRPLDWHFLGYHVNKTLVFVAPSSKSFLLLLLMFKCIISRMGKPTLFFWLSIILILFLEIGICNIQKEKNSLRAKNNLNLSFL